MSRPTRPLLCLLIVASVLFANVSSAYACSQGPNDPVAASEIIVTGRIIGWTPIHSTPTNDVEPIQLQIRVDQVFKGSIGQARVLQFLDNTSLYYGTPIKWQGGGYGACGVFNGDPSGKYVILGLYREKDGRYTSNLFLAFYVRDNPPASTPNGSDPTWSELRRVLVFLPKTGADRESYSTVFIVAGIILIMIGTALHLRLSNTRGNA